MKYLICIFAFVAVTNGAPGKPAVKPPPVQRSGGKPAPPPFTKAQIDEIQRFTQDLASKGPQYLNQVAGMFAPMLQGKPKEIIQQFQQGKKGNHRALGKGKPKPLTTQEKTELVQVRTKITRTKDQRFIGALFNAFAGFVGIGEQIGIGAGGGGYGHAPPPPCFTCEGIVPPGGDDNDSVFVPENLG